MAASLLILAFSTKSGDFTPPMQPERDAGNDRRPDGNPEYQKQRILRFFLHWSMLPHL